MSKKSMLYMLYALLCSKGYKINVIYGNVSHYTPYYLRHEAILYLKLTAQRSTKVEVMLSSSKGAFPLFRHTVVAQVCMQIN